MEEDKKIKKMLAVLEDEHRILDETITGSLDMNMMDLQRMKRQKLLLKDKIMHLHSLLHNDIIA